MFVSDPLKRSDRQLQILCLLVGFGILVLLAGLWYVQVIASERYVESEKTQSFRTMRIPAVRGKILDRNGLVLAEDRPQYNISLYLESLSPLFRKEYGDALRRDHGRKLSSDERQELQFKSRFAVVSNIVQDLGLMMNEPVDVNELQFHRHFHSCRVIPFPILENLTTAQVCRFEEQPVNPVGLDLDVQPARVYPHGATMAHIVGYVRRDTDFSNDDEALRAYRLQDVRGVYRGQVGIEGAFDEDLRGRAGVKFVQVNNLGYRQAEEIWSPARPGKNLVLTIDLPLQKAAESALQSTAIGGNVRGAVVVLNVHTGDILAMVSNPSFDPAMFLGRISPEQYQTLQDPEMTPELNRAAMGVYPPGSIFKMVTALAALEAGVIDPATPLYTRGVYPIGSGIRCTAPAGDYDFLRAMARSCNCYFIEHGLRGGTDRLLEMGARFFLGESPNLPTLQNSAGFFPSAETARQERRRGRWTDGNTANLCIGQDRITVTPVQMAVMTAALANGGKVFWPRLVERLEPQQQDGSENTTHFPARLRGELGVSAKNLELVREGMLANVESPEGSGRSAMLPGMRIAGKTGTAQVKSPGRQDHYITWFTSFAPYDAPRYAVVVMVERGAAGGATCAPVAQKIYREILNRERQAAPSALNASAGDPRSLERLN